MSRKWLWVLIVFVGLITLAVVVALRFDAFVLLRPQSPEDQCYFNIRLITVTLVVSYRDDHDSKLPLSNSWREAIRPYLEACVEKLTPPALETAGLDLRQTFARMAEVRNRRDTIERLKGEGGVQSLLRCPVTGKPYVLNRHLAGIGGTIVESELWNKTPLLWCAPADDGGAPHEVKSTDSMLFRGPRPGRFFSVGFLDGHCEMCEEAVFTKADSHVTTDYGGPFDQDDRTPRGLQEILQAAMLGDTAKMRELLADGTDVDTKGACDRTPLHQAAHHGHTELVELLLEHDANVDVQDSFGYTPLRRAADSGHIRIAEQLLEHRADVNTTDYGSLHTPLHSVIYLRGRIGEPRTSTTHSYAEMAELLLEHGADIDARDHLDYTPLHTAAEQGCSAIAKLLLAHGADVNSKDTWGETPLQRAVGYEKTEVAEIIRQHGGTE